MSAPHPSPALSLPKKLRGACRLYEADAVDEEVFQGWWSDRSKAEPPGEAARLFAEQTGKFIAWLETADSSDDDDETADSSDDD